MVWNTRLLKKRLCMEYLNNVQCNNWHLGETLLGIIKEIYINLKLRGHKKVSVELLCDIIEMWEEATQEDLDSNWRSNGGSDISFVTGRSRKRNFRFFQTKQRDCCKSRIWNDSHKRR